MDEIIAREIIGRDKLLKNHIYPRVRRKLGFMISGQRGIGKNKLKGEIRTGKSSSH